jgi:hypothetical protein
VGGLAGVACIRLGETGSDGHERWTTRVTVVAVISVTRKDNTRHIFLSVTRFVGKSH